MKSIGEQIYQFSIYIKKPFLILNIMGSLLGLFACDDEPHQIGFSSGSTANIVGSYYDTLSVSTSVILMDSIYTTISSQSLIPSQLLIGYINEVDFGSTTASAYVSFNTLDIPNSALIASSAIYDSLEIIMNVSGYFLGDTNSTQNFVIYELADSIRTGNLEDPYNYYHFDKIDAMPKEIGNLSVKPAELDTNIIRARLDDDFGKKIFDRRIDFEGDIEFNEIIKGIKITSVEKNTNLVLGIRSLVFSMLRLHYHNETAEDTSYYNIFFSRSFNGIESNFTNSVFKADWQRGEELSSEDFDRITYVQSLTGISTKITLPDIKTFLEERNAVSNRIQLILNPTFNSQMELGIPPQNLYLYRARDKDYNLTATDILSTGFNTTTIAHINAQLATALTINYNSNGNAYSNADLTLYFDPIIKGNEKNLPLFLRTITGNDNTLNGAKIGGPTYIDGEAIQIIIYYTVFK